MYKIYINEVPVILKSTQDLTEKDINTPGVLLSKYTGKVKYLLNIIDLCEKGTRSTKVIIHYDDFITMKKDFKGLFVVNEAAGGLIFSEKNECLFIFRRGFWDLPKGKTEKDETKEMTALREVNEETGLIGASIVRKLCVTNHCFKNKSGIRILKKSIWYEMKATEQKLKPQKSEDIDKAVWMSIPKFLEKCKPVYRNIIDVLKAYQNLKVN